MTGATNVRSLQISKLPQYSLRCMRVYKSRPTSQTTIIPRYGLMCSMCDMKLISSTRMRLRASLYDSIFGLPLSGIIQHVCRQCVVNTKSELRRNRTKCVTHIQPQMTQIHTEYYYGQKNTYIVI